jgi:cell volume regulation protein A
VLSIVNRLNIPDRVTTLLSLESVFTDAIVVVISIALLKIITSTPTGGEAYVAFQNIASAFSIGAIMGIIVGIIWLRILRIIRQETNDDIMTLGMALFFYALVEVLGGNGAIFALMFGLILGNGSEIASMFRSKETYEASEMMRKFMSQMSFFIRTYFFVYLGLILLIENINLIILSLVLSILLLASRYAVVRFVAFNDEVLQDNRKLITLMLPRGLAAAIMAQLVSSSNIYNAHMYPDITIIVIISTVLISSLGPFLVRRITMNGDRSKHNEVM